MYNYNTIYNKMPFKIPNVIYRGIIIYYLYVLYIINIFSTNVYI